VYARSTTFKDRPEALEAAIAMVRDEVMPAVQEMQGCVGLSMLVDRTSGSVVVTTAWASQPDLESSAPRVAPLRDRAHQLFGSRPEVQVWEIAVLHRAHQDGACARVTWTRTDPAHLDGVIDAYRESLMPWWEETPGFCSNSLLVNRRDGRCVSTVVFESPEAMAHTRDQFSTLREEFAARMRMDLLEVAEFDLALAHLRVPETV